MNRGKLNWSSPSAGSVRWGRRLGQLHRWSARCRSGRQIVDAIYSWWELVGLGIASNNVYLAHEPITQVITLTASPALRPLQSHRQHRPPVWCLRVHFTGAVTGQPVGRIPGSDRGLERLAQVSTGPAGTIDGAPEAAIAGQMTRVIRAGR